MNKVTGIKASRMWLSLGATALLGWVLGCGQIGGAGQCNGVDVTGACVSVDSVVPTDSVGFGGDTPDVDVVENQDCDGDPTTQDPEKFGEHDAKVTIEADLMKDVTSPPAPAFITFTSYTIDYTPLATNLVTAPALTSQSFGPTSLKVNTDGSQATFTLEFVNFQTKEEYVNNGGSLYPPASYSAKYTFRGTSQFDQDVVLVGSATFNMGNYDNCSK
ncbi:MAG TPA: hypothetical protein VLY20_12765 [Nitrospiria bacterium]|nr:hypothetical protein [Nitrospiria bacterium]HUK57517.1 hypothetical protein [Nitrospiria bacterium]